jgi:hypothetical protein
MIGKHFSRARLPRAAAVGLALTALVSGCVTYTQSELASMDAVDICELEYRQGRNLTPETKQTIQAEMQRRKDSCRSHSVEVAKRFDDFMWQETYGKQAP